MRENERKSEEKGRDAGDLITANHIDPKRKRRSIGPRAK